MQRAYQKSLRILGKAKIYFRSHLHNILQNNSKKLRNLINVLTRYVARVYGVAGVWAGKGALPCPTFWLLMFFIINHSKKKLKKCENLKTEIHCCLRKKSISKFSLYNLHQTTQCFSNGIIKKNII